VTPEDKAKLRKLAEAATPGPWEYYYETGFEGQGVVITYTEDNNGMRTIRDVVFKRLVTSEINKAYLAEASPTTILSLLDENERLELELEAQSSLRDKGISATNAHARTILDGLNVAINARVNKLEAALKKIADPRLRDHKEPDKYTECACMMYMAEEALQQDE
jgi:hypothetical protein